MHRTWFVALLVLPACGNLKDDVTAMCDVPADVEKSADGVKADPSQRVRIVIEHDEKVVRSRDGKALITWLKTYDENRPTDARAARMREEATKAGISQCRFADELRAADEYNGECKRPDKPAHCI